MVPVQRQVACTGGSCASQLSRCHCHRREAQLEKAHGTPESLDAVLQEAVKYCPRAEVLWLMAAKEKWLAGQVPAARDILKLAFDANPESEDIWLAAFKLEFENQVRANLSNKLFIFYLYGQSGHLWQLVVLRRVSAGCLPELSYLRVTNHSSAGQAGADSRQTVPVRGVQEPERARIILAKARGEGEARVPASSTQRVWMKSAVVERELGDTAEERRLLRAALERFPYFDKLWLMLGQLEQRGGAVAAARLAYQNGLKRCISSVPLWRVRRFQSGCVLICPAQWCSLLPPGSAAGSAFACSPSSRHPPSPSGHVAIDISVQAAARLEEQAGNMSKARAILEQGRHKNKGNEELWLISVRTELRAGLPKAADSLMAKALQVTAPPLGQHCACKHGLMWSSTLLWHSTVQTLCDVVPS